MAPVTIYLLREFYRQDVEDIGHSNIALSVFVNAVCIYVRSMYVYSEQYWGVCMCVYSVCM